MGDGVHRVAGLDMSPGKDRDDTVLQVVAELEERRVDVVADAGRQVFRSLRRLLRIDGRIGQTLVAPPVVVLIEGDDQ